MSDKPNPVEPQRHPAGVDYPADRDGLLKAARDHGAEDSLVERLEKLPERRYTGPDKVSEALFRS